MVLFGNGQVRKEKGAGRQDARQPQADHPRVHAGCQRRCGGNPVAVAHQEGCPQLPHRAGQRVVQHQAGADNSRQRRAPYVLRFWHENPPSKGDKDHADGHDQESACQARRLGVCQHAFQVLQGQLAWKEHPERHREQNHAAQGHRQGRPQGPGGCQGGQIRRRRFLWHSGLDPTRGR